MAIQWSRVSKRLLLVLATLVAISIAGSLAGADRRFLLMGLFAAPAVLLFTLRSFSWMVLAIPFAAMFFNFSLPVGGGSQVSQAMLLVCALSAIWVLMFVMVRRKFILYRSVLNAPLFAFMTVCCLSLVWSITFRDPLVFAPDRFVLVQLGALTAMVASPLAALLIANFVEQPRHMMWICWAFVAAGAAFTALRLVGRETEYINSRGLFTMWFTACAFSFVLIHPDLKLWQRLGLFGLLALNLYVMAFKQVAWLSGWVPALAVIAVILAVRSKLATLVLLVVLAVVGWTYQDFYVETFSSEQEVQGNTSRVTLWENSFDLAADHPVLGTGPAGYAVYYLTYHPLEARSTHNNYLDIIAQTGIIGTLSWLWIVVAAIREGYAVLKHAPPGPFRTVGVAACSGLVGAAVAMMLGDWVLPFAYNQGIEGYRYTVYSWIFLGILMSIRRQVAPLEQPSRHRYGFRTRRFGYSR